MIVFLDGETLLSYMEIMVKDQCYCFEHYVQWLYPSRKW